MNIELSRGQANVHITPSSVDCHLVDVFFAEEGVVTDLDANAEQERKEGVPCGAGSRAYPIVVIVIMDQ